MSLSLAPQMDSRQREKERAVNIEKHRVPVPAEALDSYADDYRYQSTGKSYLIHVGAGGANLRSQSPDNNCRLIPQTNQEFAAVECSGYFTGTFTFRKNKQGGSELSVSQPTRTESVCPKVE